jgi:hypothetical protein
VLNSLSFARTAEGLKGYKPDFAKALQMIGVTARTKCYSIDEGSFVDCTIEDTKLKREEEGRKGGA